MRIIKLNALINHGQIEVYSTCSWLIEEALSYKFALDKDGTPTSKPVDGNDHGITALEFSIIDLPHNLSELHLKAYLPPGTKIIHDKKNNGIIKKASGVFNPLEEDTDNVRNNSDYMFNNLDSLNHSFSGTGTYVYAENPFSSNPSEEEEGDDSDDDDLTPTLRAYISNGLE